MQAFVLTILAFAFILFLVYRGLLNEILYSILFVNHTKDALAVKINFKYRFYYRGTKGDSSGEQYAPLKPRRGNALILSCQTADVARS